MQKTWQRDDGDYLIILPTKDGEIWVHTKPDGRIYEHGEVDEWFWSQMEALGWETP